MKYLIYMFFLLFGIAFSCTALKPACYPKEHAYLYHINIYSQRMNEAEVFSELAFLGPFIVENNVQANPGWTTIFISLSCTPDKITILKDNFKKDNVILDIQQVAL